MDKIGPVLISVDDLDLIRRYADRHERTLPAEIRVAVRVYLRHLQQREPLEDAPTTAA